MNARPFFLCLMLLGCMGLVSAQTVTHGSYYTQKPTDQNAYYFTPDNYPIKADGRTDVTDALQKAINDIKRNRNFGILFIPEGKYLISKTIYVPNSIRLIGYGKKRPLITLKQNSPDFQTEPENDKGHAHYMFWFTSRLTEPGDDIHDAGAGTFYSGFSNIDLKIDKGNPAAVALRTHYAQHSFVSHVTIDAGEGKAGLFDIGNFMEDVTFLNGDYGIYTTKASPGWQFMMMDTYFEGQRKSAIKSQQAGFTIARMYIKNVPAALIVDENYWEKLYMEDSHFENIQGPAIQLSNEGNANTQLNIRNLVCKNVPELVYYPKSKTVTKAPSNLYRVNNYVYGLQQDGLKGEPSIELTNESEPLSRMPAMVPSDVPALPAMKTWFNVKDAGAKGDGETDDTQALQKAIAEHATLYFPEGSYRISETLKLKPNTVLIGLHPMATNIALKEDAPAFGGFGSPKAMVESSEGGTNIITGIGLYTGENNFRAVACKWMAGPTSMVNDVKFIGGHGTMRPGPKLNWKWEEPNRGDRRNASYEDAWDTQYWSLWVTNNGGGIFKNIWTASTFATNGFYASNTSTRGRVYAMSVEHHVRNEVRFNKVSNWKVFALQLEEESRESSECQPLEVQQCSNMTFANLYMFRVIRVQVPYPYSIRTWGCSDVEFLNVHNYSQIKYTTDNPLYDINTNIEVRPTELARLYIKGDTPTLAQENTNATAQLLGEGFEFVEGAAHDSKGNVYFAEQRMRRIYKWSADTQQLSLVADFPWQPLSLGTDSEDNLLVVFRYDPQPGFMVNGEQEHFENPADAKGTSFSGWGNSGFVSRAYSIDPNNPEATITELKTVPMASVKQVYKALYPSNRWRDYHDFNQVSVNRNENAFLAPDGKTIIPVCYDLARATALVEAFPGKPVYAADEYDKRTVKMDVDAQGYLSNLTYFVEKGEFNSITGPDGKLYVADGDVYVYDANGKYLYRIQVPERPSSLSFGGKDGKTLFATGRSTFYKLQTQ